MTRRFVLRTGALATLASLVSSCARDRVAPVAGSASPTAPAATASSKAVAADIRLVVAAIADEEAALLFCTRAGARFPTGGDRLLAIALMQREHVARLRASLVRLRPPASGRHPRLPADAGDLSRALVGLETALAGNRGADCLAAASGPLAELFGSMAASHAAEIVAIGPTASTEQVIAVPRAVQNVAAFTSCLAAEYAAVFGYGVLGGVLTAGVSDTPLASAARSSYDAHRARRDLLVGLFTKAEQQVPTADPAYRIPFDVTGSATARRLARLIEARCAAVYLRAVGATVDDSRRFAEDVLVDCARRGVGWGAVPTAFPGLPS